jgi:hypothetical protein
MTDADIVEITVSQWNATNATTCVVEWAGQVDATDGSVSQFFFVTEGIHYGPEIDSDYPIQTIDKSYEDVGDNIPVIITTFDSRSRLQSLMTELRRCLRAYNGGTKYKYTHIANLKEVFQPQGLFKAEGNVVAQYAGQYVA